MVRNNSGSNKKMAWCFCFVFALLAAGCLVLFLNHSILLKVMGNWPGVSIAALSALSIGLYFALVLCFSRKQAPEFIILQLLSKEIILRAQVAKIASVSLAKERKFKKLLE